MDGLYSACTGNPQVPTLDWENVRFRIKPQQQADADSKKLCSFSCCRCDRFGNRLENLQGAHWSGL